MSIFGTRPLICAVCRVYFEADPAFERWNDWCPVHRHVPMMRDLLKDAVMKWCDEHWEEVGELLEKKAPAIAELREEYKKAVVAEQSQAIMMGEAKRRLLE